MDNYLTIWANSPNAGRPTLSLQGLKETMLTAEKARSKVDRIIIGGKTYSASEIRRAIPPDLLINFPTLNTVLEKVGEACTSRMNSVSLYCCDDFMEQEVLEICLTFLGYVVDRSANAKTYTISW